MHPFLPRDNTVGLIFLDPLVLVYEHKDLCGPYKVLSLRAGQEQLVPLESRALRCHSVFRFPEILSLIQGFG